MLTLETALAICLVLILLLLPLTLAPGRYKACRLAAAREVANSLPAAGPGAFYVFAAADVPGQLPLLQVSPQTLLLAASWLRDSAGTVEGWLAGR